MEKILKNNELHLQEVYTNAGTLSNQSIHLEQERFDMVYVLYLVTLLLLYFVFLIRSFKKAKLFIGNLELILVAFINSLYRRGLQK